MPAGNSAASDWLGTPAEAPARSRSAENHKIIHKTAIDATTFKVFQGIGIDDYTPGGLAAIPVPEPHPLILQMVGGLVVVGLARRRRLKRTRE